MITSPARALIHNADTIAADLPRIKKLIQCVDKPTDLSPPRWIQLMAFVLDFKPDIILELGRGYGNSTCVFTETCHLLAPLQCSVASLCISGGWEERTSPRIRDAIGNEWFEPLHTLNADIIHFDYEHLLSGNNRVVLFWDAHGYDIAEVVLGEVLPLIQNIPHLVIIHDLIDSRYSDQECRYYGNKGIWKGGNACDGSLYWVENIRTCVEEAIPLLDFCNRNQIQLHSSTESFMHEVTPEEWKGLEKVIDTGFISNKGHWSWFSLHESPVELTFPRPAVREGKNPGLQ